MSIQSDIEMLSIQAMETYAKRNHITGEEAINIFYRYQVFEKIMIQHEYLHQVGFEEVMNYVEQIIQEDLRLGYNNVNNQISFHNKKALESLKLVRRTFYE